MPTPFSIPGSRYSGTTDPALRQEIQRHTGNDGETSSILRSIARFGGDSGIRSYEVTPKPRQGNRHDPRTLSWTVRAVRG